MNKCLMVKSKTNNPNKLIVKIYEMGIDIKNINYLKDGIEFEIKYEDYKRLIKYIKSYKFRIKSYIGFFNVINFIKNSKVFIINLMLSIILLFVFSNTIVSVKVLHSNKYIRDILYSSLDEYGIKRLSWKKSYNELTNIKNKILAKYKDDIEWLEIEKKGMNYIIRVEQRIIPKEKVEKEYCNVVATKDAVIKSISYNKGQSLVEVNDYVKKGDVLVSGEIKFNEEIKGYTCADAMILGESWYKTSITMPLVKTENKYTGKKRYNFMIGDTKIFKSRLNKYKTKKKKIISVFGIDFYLLKELEVNEFKEKLGYDKALKEALRLSRNKIKLKLEKKENIISQKVLKKSINNSTMYVEIFTTVNEVISKVEESAKKDNEVE